MRLGHLNVWIISDNSSSNSQSFENLIQYNANQRWLHIRRNSKHTIFTVYGKKKYKINKNYTTCNISVNCISFFSLITSSSLTWETETLFSPQEALCPQLRTGVSYLSRSICWHTPEHNTPLWFCDLHLCPIHETTSVQEAAVEASQLWQNPLVRKHCGGCKQFEKEGRTWNLLLVPVSQT